MTTIITIFVYNFLVLFVLELPLLAKSVYTRQGFKADFSEFAISPVVAAKKSSYKFRIIRIIKGRVS
jgi:hypothetical protein